MNADNPDAGRARRKNSIAGHLPPLRPCKHGSTARQAGKDSRVPTSRKRRILDKGQRRGEKCFAVARLRFMSSRRFSRAPKRARESAGSRRIGLDFTLADGGDRASGRPLAIGAVIGMMFLAN
jgi:hypothetical protein